MASTRSRAPTSRAAATSSDDGRAASRPATPGKQAKSESSQALDNPSCGFPRIDELREHSLARALAHTEEDIAVQIQIWNSMIATTQPLPSLDSTSWATWSAAFFLMIYDTHSAYIFFDCSEDDEKELSESHIHDTRLRWVRSALLKCTSSNYVRDGITSPSELLKWIRSYYSSSSAIDTSAVVAQIRSFRARASESLPDYLARFSALSQRIDDCTTLAGPLEWIDNMKKAIILQGAAISPSPEINSFSTEWLTKHATESCASLVKDELWHAISTPKVAAARPPRKSGTVRCRFCKALGHEEKVCRKKKKDGKDGKDTGKGKAVFGTVDSVPVENSSVPSPCIGLYELDSGSPIHISGNREHFLSLSPISEEQRSITGHSLQVGGIGCVRIHQPKLGLELLLKDVRFCPSAKSNIISVSALEKTGHYIDWSRHPDPVRVSLNDRPVAQLYRVNSGFYAKFKINLPTIDAVRVQEPPSGASSDISGELWHRRLAHINHRYVKNTAKYSGVMPSSVCETCVQAKQTKKLGGTVVIDPDAKPFDRVFVDLGGGKEALPEGVSVDRVKARYFILFTDEVTRFRWVYHLEVKPNTTESIENFLAMVKTQFNATPKVLRSDGGREFNNDEVSKMLKKRGILWEPTAARSPEQNGVSERSMRTLMQTNRAMLSSSGVPRRYWPYALDTAVYLWNRTSNKSKSPYELLYGTSPEIGHLRVFGCVAYAHDPSQKPKLDSRSKTMCFVGYGCSNVFLLLDPRTGNVVRRRDVVFDEQNTLDWEIYGRQSDQHLVQYETPSFGNPRTKKINAIVTHPSHAVPSSYREATHVSDADEWQSAMQHEIDQLAVNETWKLVPRSEIPKSAKLLTGKWVYRRKDDGSYKARWVVRGFNEDGLDIGDTYAATLQATTVRMLFAWAVQKRHFIRQADISSAFLNSPVDRDIFVLQPTGFTAGRHVCKLSRSLYGLRTAPKDWYDTLSSLLLELGFTPSKYDKCLFRRGEVALSIFVDDINLFGPDDNELADILQAINKRFKLRDMGPISTYLGMDVKYDRDAGTLTINQAAKIRQLLDDCGLTSALSRGTPIDPGATVPIPPATDENPAVGEHEHAIFRGRLGSLLHIACFTRPDILYAVNVLTRVQNAPTDAAIGALLYLLRYLKGTIEIGIVFKRDKTLGLVAFSDSSWAKKYDARSTSGVVFMINGAPILWHSKLQTIIARSTCEAEYVAADLAAREATWLQLFWHEICCLPTSSEPEPIPLGIDSQSALALAQKEGVQSRNRHFLIRVEALREAQKRRIVKLHYIPSTSMAADGFTKVLTASGQQNFLRLINMAVNSKSCL